MAEISWTGAEKKIARRVFDKALENELAEIMMKFKKKAQEAKVMDDIWKTKDYLIKAQNEINRKYDFRYSVLGIVFGVLLREKRIAEHDLNGLSLEKINMIIGISKIKV